MRRTPWNRQRLNGLLWQVVVVGIAVAIVDWLWSNALHNLSVRRISTGSPSSAARRMPLPTLIAYSPRILTSAPFWSASSIRSASP